MIHTGEADPEARERLAAQMLGLQERGEDLASSEDCL